MFAFYFAILSAITPPVALAVYAANSTREGGHVADRARRRSSVGAAGYIVPFMFVYEPALLMIGSWDRILLDHGHRDHRRDRARRLAARLPACGRPRLWERLLLFGGAHAC